MSTSIEAGWYDDPDDSAFYRYWDGRSWTERTVPKEASLAAASMASEPEGSDVVDAAPSTVAQSIGIRDESRPPRQPTTSATRTHRWVADTEPWCRACGQAEIVPTETCPNCSWPLGLQPDISGRIGLVYEVGKLRKRLAVCVGESTSAIRLHVDDKEDRMVELTELPAVTDHTSTKEPPLVRLHRFEELRAAKAVRTRTSQSRILEVAAMLRDAASMRSLYDTALAEGWSLDLDSIHLSPFEKAWRSAHHCAQTDDCSGLLEQLRDLPRDGFVSRVGLLMPHFDELAAHHRDDLLQLLLSWNASIPGVAGLLSVLEPNSASATDLRRCSDLFIGALPPDSRSTWSRGFSFLNEGKLDEPVRGSCRSWAAYRAFSTRETGRQLEPDHLPFLAPAFLEQLVADGGLTIDAAQAHLSGDVRSYVLARLQPDLLTEGELRSVGHWAELARRAFLDENESMLLGLPPEDGAIRHYLALLRFRIGDDYEPTYLRPTAREKLDAFAAARAAVLAGETTTLPDRLLDDPTLWPALRQQALDGKLTVGLDQRLVSSEFAEWVDLHALVAMLWNGDYLEAERLGSQLADLLQVERLRDEALNLRAFALYQMGRVDEALAALEDAMEGDYTEALLVNTSVVATAAEPTVAAGYLARLINEAPTDDLRVAALRQAINVWTGEDQMPPETTESLRRVLDLPSLSDSDYISFIGLRSNVDRSRFVSDPPSRPDTLTKAMAFDVYLAKAMSLEGVSDPGSTSRVLVSAMGNLPDTPWLRAEFDRWVDLHFEILMTSNYDEAPVSALEFNALLDEGQQYLSRPIYYAGAPLAGINYSSQLTADGDLLDNEAAIRFFFLPSEQFTHARADMPEGLADQVEFTLYGALSALLIQEFIVVLNRISQSDQRYNQLNQRQAYDAENRFQIKNQMRSLLATQLEWLEPFDRTLDHLDRYRPGPGVLDERRQHVEDVRRDLSGQRQEIIRLRARL